MNLDSFFNRAAFSIETLAQELYDPTKPGVVALENVLTPSFCELAIEDFKRKAHFFKDSPEVENETRQQLKNFYYGSADGGAGDTGQFPLVSRLREAYSSVYKQISNRCNFWQGPVINSQGVHWYPSGSCGMGIHRDYSSDINLLSLFVLSGNASFTVYDDKKGSNKLYEITTLPGMWVGMRGPRSPRENESRPYHEIGIIEDERFSLIFRQKKQKLH